MQKHWPKLIVALCSIVLFNCTGRAAYVSKPATSEVPKALRMQVSVTVKGDEGITSSVSSCLKKELQSFSDVDIVDTNFRFQLSVLAMQTELAGFYKTGIVLSTVILIPFDNSILLYKFRPEYKNDGLQLTSRLFLEQDHWLNMGSPGDLEDICKKIVAKFDAQYLQTYRKTLRQ
jgi:hypothetical protein